VTAPLSYFTTDQRISLLIHAASKVGKSTLSGTAPKPILVLDAEGSWRFINLRKVYWEPSAGPPPVYDGSWDACVVHVREWGTVETCLQWLRSYQLPFTSVVVDSVTEIQRRCKENLRGEEAMKIQDWGTLLSRMDKAIRGFRDLALLPGINVRCVVFIAETRQSQAGKWVPFMQGQISTALPYWMDICGYLYPDRDVDANGQPTLEVRRLLIAPNSQFEAGERVQGRLGGLITVPQPAAGTSGDDIERWMQVIFGVTPTPIATPAPQAPREEVTQ
jgi:hypothetical protein